MTTDHIEQEKCSKQRSGRRISATAKKEISAKFCLDKVTKSGIKYAIAWVTYVVIGSYIFILLEENYPPSALVTKNEWVRFRGLLYTGEVVDELLSLRTQLKQNCSHHALHSSFDDILLESKVQTSSKKSIQNNKNLSLRIELPEKWLMEIEEECEAATSTYVLDHTPPWSMVDAIFYTMTLVTTIGFGHISPRSPIGRMFCIVYALVGVPLTCILMAKNSEMLSHRMLRLYESVRKRLRVFKPKTVLFVVTWMYLSLGFLVFMFLPSLVFVLLEGWTYVDALYYTFITLTTIGFGDLIAGYNNPESDAYKISIVIWIMCALGYWVMLLNFLQKAIKSNAKTIRRRFNAKKIAKQAEFLKHLMTKVKTESNGVTTSPEEKLHMMAIMVESLSRKGSFMVPPSDGMVGTHCMAYPPNATQSHSNLFLSGSQKDNEASEELFEDEPPTDDSSLMMSSSKCDSPITFDDLMNVIVSLKTETLPGIEALVAHTDKNHFQDTLQSVVSGEKEIRLPLRDVIGLVLTVASLEGQDMPSYWEIPSESESPTATTSAPSSREALPLLKTIFMNSKEKSPTSPKSNFIQRTLSHYMEKCEDREEDFEEGCRPNQISNVGVKQQALMV